MTIANDETVRLSVRNPLLPNKSEKILQLDECVQKCFEKFMILGFEHFDRISPKFSPKTKMTDIIGYWPRIGCVEAESQGYGRSAVNSGYWQMHSTGAGS